ncbi:hypothetical protein, partial [Cellulomonas olei]|uniref:hypothetical protein n=1 Tax=Cellulomonas sp. P4 TaxID=3142533 RepID=UPI0031BBACBB
MTTSAASSTSELLPGYQVDPATGAWCSIPWPGDPSLPWNHPERVRLLPPTLGPQLIRWGEARLLHPLTGRPWRYTPGQKRWMILWYALDVESGRWLYRSGVKRGAKGTGKDPFGGAMSLTELCGPVQYAGVADGRPVGESRGLALVQIAANSQAQAADLLRVANAMVSEEMQDEFGIDTGETRTTADTGRIELLTFSERSSEGDPATAIFLNESHHMTESSGGHKVADTARRNVAKSPSYIQARLVELTNAHQEGMDSVAERSFQAWQSQMAGRGKRDILYDSIEAPPATNVYDEADRLRGLAAAYSDAPWADLQRLSDEMLDERTPVGDSIRFYYNGLAAAEDAWVEPENFKRLSDASKSIEPGDRIAMFLDCSKSTDATGLVACRLSDGHTFVLGIWQAPHGARGKGWLAPRPEVDAVVRKAFADYSVAWFGVDPSPARDDDDEALYWMPLVDAWHRDFRRKVKVWATPGAGGHSVKFDMRTSQPGGKLRNKAFTEAAMQVEHMIDSEPGQPFTHDGHPALLLHTYHAKRRPNQWGHTLGKQNR